jgi:hypothetical protein
MLGTPPCKASGWEGALGTTTFTGTDKSRVVCDIGTRHDIRHFVLLKNLLAYETRIRCTSQINSKPRFIHFKSPTPNDTEDEWTAECILSNYGEYTFSHVRLGSRQPGSGDQIIKVHVEIDRLRQRGTVDSASLQITVTA